MSARDASILRKQHADKPDGMAIGAGFVFFPKIEVDLEYDDNVFRTRNNRQGDFIVRVRPGFVVSSDWGEHSLEFFATGELARYADLDTANYEGFSTGFKGKYDLTGDLAWTTDADFSRTALPFAAPGLFGFTSGRRTIVHVFSASTNLVYGGDPFYGRIGPRVRRVTYVRGTSFDEDFNIYELTGRAGYRFTPDFSVFIDPSYQIVRFDRNVDLGGVRRNNHGFDVRLGVAYDVSRDVTAEAGVGYFRRWFDGGGKPEDGLSFLARLYWNPTDNISVEAEARRAFTQYRLATPTAAALGNAVETYFGARVGWEPLEPLLVDAGAAYGRYTFSGSGNKENYLFFDAGAKYFFNPHFYAGPRYYHERRFAKPSALNYTDNRFMVTLGAQW
ncbi:MAG TPA: outer membrane beta-barrel protein [Vineibacter sp.]|nr:outer membrane beta-barrel protein [Vineibacter sp.]